MSGRKDMGEPIAGGDLPPAPSQDRLQCSACGAVFKRSEMKATSRFYELQIEHPEAVGACPHCGADGTVSP